MRTLEVSEEERFDYDFKEPRGAKYFIVNANNNALFFFTNSREKAQNECDNIYGKGKYKIRVVMKAQVR